MKFRTLLPAGIVFMVSALAGYYFYQQQASRPPTAAEPPQAPSSPAKPDSLLGQPAPEFTLADLSGTQRNLHEWSGEVVVLNFWATWCPPCLKEIPELIDAQDKYADQGFSVIGIALQNADEVSGFVREKGMNYPVLAGEMDVLKTAQALGNDIGALPYTVILDRQGNIAHIKAGQISGEELETAITPLL